jgi:hypothetical protein
MRAKIGEFLDAVTTPASESAATKTKAPASENGRYKSTENPKKSRQGCRRYQKWLPARI